MKKSLLLALLLFCITINAQESKFLIFPGCEKFERKGNKKLIDCYSSNFNKLLSNEVQKVLRDNNLSFDNVNVNAKIKYEINKEGEYQNLEIEGTEAEKSLLNLAFYNYVIKLKRERKKIIPATSKLGEPALLKFDIPFKIINLFILN